MIKEIFSVVVSAAVLIVLFTGTGFAGINDGMVAYYPFDGSADDASGNGHYGTVYGATLAEDRFGNADAAYAFDGMDDVIMVKENGDFNTENSLSISLWIKFLSNPPCNRPTSFVSKSAVPPVGRNSGYVFPYIAFNRCDAFGLIVNTLGDWRWDFNRSFSYSSIPDPFLWHLYTATYDGNARRVYLDGEPVAVDYQSGAILPNSNDLAIGTQPGTPEWAHAVMDDIRIYNRALSQEEIRELFAIRASVEIDPDTLNLKSKGKWVTAYIELPEAFSAYDIRPDRVAISGIGGSLLSQPLRAEGPYGVGDQDGDGTLDMMVKFDRQALAAILGGENAVISISGELWNGNRFEGIDTLRVIAPEK